MAQATAWLRHSFLLSPSASRSLSLARRRIQQYSLPFSLLLKRKTYPSISASLCSSTDAAAPSAFHLHNTLTKRKEPFRPTVEGKVGMYVCGITAYDLSHIGHARVSVVFDVLYRIDGDVYLSVDKYPPYGQLSGRRLEDNQPGQRVAVDSRKQNPADFALWKSSKAGEPFWESPWGPGKPGWHIECSAMSATYLGYSFDVHGGGMDLVFPHHENEIAESCAACKESNVSYWVHNGFVDVGSEKMSKSLGNFVTIRQVIDFYHPLALRLFLIGTHYRSTISYSIAQLEISSDRLYYIY